MITVISEQYLMVQVFKFSLVFIISGILAF